MPPKRKRTDEGTSGTTTRATRASTRSQGKATPQADSATSGSHSVASRDSDVEMEPPAKKTRKPVGRATKAKATKGRTKKELDDLGANGKEAISDGPRPGAQSSKQSASSKNTPESKPEPYSIERVTGLFSQYVDEDASDVIGPEGFERLCNEAQIPMDGAAPLLLAWQLGATELAKIQKSEWMKGMDELRISSLSILALALRELEDLLLLGKPALKQPRPTANKPSPSSSDPYDRSRYHRYSRGISKAYGELYMFSFMLAKPETSRSIDMETASAIWSVVVTPKYPTMKDVLEFISEKGTYKGVNKDLWTMTLEFCQTVSPNLEGYDLDGAWPTMLDEFVNWQRKKIATSNT